MHQSPLSKRAKGPAERESVDGLAEVRSGSESGTGTGSNAPGGSGKPTVPAMDRGPGGNVGGVSARDETVSTGGAANMGSGGPGMAKSEDAMRKGGTPERFTSDRGRNS